MLTADKRGVSARRGMTVLGKIPAVPKPINLPSQRLENRGLDPNVEIVPRGSVSWGAAGRSPPISGHVWGNSQQSFSPPVSSPVSSAPWGAVNKLTGESLPASRPSSAGNGSRPSTTDSSRQIQVHASSANAWNLSPSRPSSASGALGHGHSQSSLNRPKSAETRPSNLQRSSTQFPEVYTGNLTRQTGESVGSAGVGSRPSTADSSRQIQVQTSNANAWNLSPTQPSSASGDFGHGHSQSLLSRPKSAETRPSNLQRSSTQFRETYTETRSTQAWGPSGSKILADEHPGNRFTLSHGDFPRLGSEKNEGLHSQQRMPAISTSEFERKANFTVDNWKRDCALSNGPPPAPDGSLHGDGIPLYPGHLPSTESWRKDGHGGVASGHSSSDYWPIAGPHPGSYGGGVAPIFHRGRFPYDCTGFMHHQQFGPGPLPPPRSVPVGYDPNGDGLRNVPFMRPPAMIPDRRGPPFGPMYASPMPYEGFYPGPSVPGYGNMEDCEMMVGMGNRPSFYGGFPHSPEPFGPCQSGFGFGGSHPGVVREGMETVYERESHQGVHGNAGTFLRENDDWNDTRNKVDRTHIRQPGKVEVETNSWKRDWSGASDADSQVQRNCNRGLSDHPSHGHQDWGAASFVDEPMDFSRPVFEDDMTSRIKKEESHFSLHSDISSWEDDQEKERKVDDYLGETVMQMGTLDTDLKSEATVESFSIETYALKKEDSPQNNQRIPPDPSRVDAETISDDKADASPASVTPHSPVCNPPTNDDVNATGTPVGGIGNQLNSSDESAGLETAGPCFGKVGEKMPASLLMSDSASYNGDTSAISEKNSVDFPTGLCVTSAVDPIPMPVVEVPLDFCTSDEYVQTGQESEQPHQDKINQDLSWLESGTDVNKMGSVTTLLGDKKGETSAGNKRVHHPREDHRYKLKATPHDIDKEWRPKSVRVERDEKPKSSSNITLVPKKPQTVSASFQPVETVSEPVHAVEKSLSSTENTESSVYDYDAQRAKMKEIAAQRAQQLQKEEAERTKEQKAKALAKLEELNRRTVAAVEKSSDSSKEFCEVGLDSMQLEKSAAICTKKEPSEALATATSSAQTFSEQAKPVSQSGLEPDLKETSGDASQRPNESAELSPANVTCSQLHDAHKPSGHQHANFKAPHLRHRSKPFAPHLKDVSKQPDLAKIAGVDKADSVVCVNDQIIDEQHTGIMCSHDFIATEISSKKPVVGQSGHHTPLRKKRNNRKENLTFEAKTGPSSLLNEIVNGSDYSSDAMNHNEDTPAFVKTITPPSGSVNNIESSKPSTLPQESSTFVWKDTSEEIGDVSKEILMDEVVKVPQKHQQFKRSTRERVPQDIRASEKQQSGESMIWAPVRINSNDVGGSLKGDDTPVSDPINLVKDVKFDNQQSPEVKRAELKRYTPKAIRRHPQNEHSSESVPLSGQTNSFQYENQSSAINSMSRVSTQQKSRQSPYISNQQMNYRSGGRQHEFVGKSGHSQSSWRQRGIISEQASDNVKEDLVHSMEDRSSLVTLERGTRGKQFDNRQQGNLPQTKQQQSRPTEGNWESEQASFKKKERGPSSPQRSYHNQSIAVNENSEQKWVTEEDYTEVLDHSSVPASTYRHRARNVVKNSGQIVYDNVDASQGNASNHKQVRDQQKLGKRADLAPRTSETFKNKDQETGTAQDREQKKSHQTITSHPPSRNAPPSSRGWTSSSQRNEPEISQSHYSSHTPDASDFVSNVQDGSRSLSRKASEKIPSNLQFGPSPTQHTKGGPSFDRHGREESNRTLQPPSKHAERNSQQGSHATYDHDQRDASNSYRKSSLGQQLQHRKSVSQEKLQHSGEGYDSYERPWSLTSTYTKQYDAASVDKGIELTNCRPFDRSENFREHKPSFESGNRPPNASRFQNVGKNFRHVERVATPEGRYDNDQKVYEAQWSEGGDTLNGRGRDHSHSRRGKFGGRMNAKSTGADSKRHSTKQDLVIDAPTVAPLN